MSLETKINWFTQPTGDPFADVGGYVIEYLLEKYPEKSIQDLIKEVTDIYVKNWDNNLHSFFLNSTITHNSNKGQKGIDKTISFYKSLFDGKELEQGICRITGQKGNVFNGARDNHVMSGSGTFINFHHGFESGIQLSKEALIRIYFIPLGVEQLGNKVALLISNNEEVTRFFVRKNVDNNFKDIASGISETIQRSVFSNPINALFDFANQCIENVRTITFDEETGTSLTADVTLNLFHFTNFGAKPTAELITLPATVFSFYAYCLVRHGKEWRNFISRFYSNSKFKKTEFDPISNNLVHNSEQIDLETFKTWKNKVLDDLIKESSILKYFLYHSKKFQLNFIIVELYQIKIRKMDKRTLTKIRELSDFIVIGRPDDDIKKSISRLNGAKKNHELRHFLLKLVVKNYADGNPNPLFSLEEYVEYLFPEGTNWQEIRDLILIAIYQRLHELNKIVEVDLIDEEEEIENQNN